MKEERYRLHRGESGGEAGPGMNEQIECESKEMRYESYQSSRVVERRFVVECTDENPDDQIEMLPRPLSHERNRRADETIQSIDLSGRGGGVEGVCRDGDDGRVGSEDGGPTTLLEIEISFVERSERERREGKDGIDNWTKLRL